MFYLHDLSHKPNLKFFCYQPDNGRKLEPRFLFYLLVNRLSFDLKINSNVLASVILCCHFFKSARRYNFSKQSNSEIIYIGLPCSFINLFKFGIFRFTAFLKSCATFFVGVLRIKSKRYLKD